jgi:integrase
MPLIKLENHDYIYERISADGRLTSYQVKIRKKGFAEFIKSFDDLEEAKLAVYQVMIDQGHNHKIDRLAGEKMTFGNVIEQSIERLESGRRKVKGKRDELYRLRAFLRKESGLCAVAMAHLTQDMLEDWIERRLDVVKPGTVLRDIRVFKPLVTKAVRKLHLAENPFEDIENPVVRDQRIVRLTEEDEARLFCELANARSHWVLSASIFALETGCRRGELLRLEWRDYDAKGATIWLDDAKNGRGRYILLTCKAQAVIESLPQRDEGGFIFKVTSNLLKQAFENARERAELETWRWHDFRHEAISRCFDEGWTAEQVMDFSGHVDGKSLLRYRHPKVGQSVGRLRALEASRGAQTEGLRIVR